MEFFEGIRDLIKPPTEVERKVRSVKKEVRAILGEKEKELKAAGDRSVSFYQFDKEFSLRWDLRMCAPSIANRTGWESRSLQVNVLADAISEVKFGYKEPEEQGMPTFSEHLNIETQPEYKLAQKSSKLLAQEFGDSPEQANNKDLSLKDRIDIAMKFAQYTTDGRYDRSLD